MNISAIVMASGLARRMNIDKLHLEINHKKIYEYILLTLKQCNFKEVIVVAKDEEIIQRALDLGYKAIKNNHSYLGQSVSIKLALDNLQEAKGFMFFVSDQPFIKEETISKLCKEFIKNPEKIVLPYIEGVNKNPVIFPSYLTSELMALEGDQGGRVVINKNLDKVLKVNFEDEDEFFDIDTLEDYKKAIEMKGNIYE